MADKRDGAPAEETTQETQPQETQPQGPQVPAVARMSRDDLDQNIAEHQDLLASLQTQIREAEGRLADLQTLPLERTDISRMDADTRKDLLPHECRVCGARFQGKFGLDQHLQDFHPGVRNRPVPEEARQGA